MEVHGVNTEVNKHFIIFWNISQAYFTIYPMEPCAYLIYYVYAISMDHTEWSKVTVSAREHVRQEPRSLLLTPQSLARHWTWEMIYKWRQYFRVTPESNASARNKTNDKKIHSFQFCFSQLCVPLYPLGDGFLVFQIDHNTKLSI